jgi:hypothetical protein
MLPLRPDQGGVLNSLGSVLLRTTRERLVGAPRHCCFRLRTEHGVRLRNRVFQASPELAAADRPNLWIRYPAHSGSRLFTSAALSL